MHVLIVTDQHPESLGGVQVAIRLQRRALERLGHRVTIAAPALHRREYITDRENREAYVDLPSRPITRDREYGLSWPGARTDRVLAAALADRPRADLVHVQGDFWGAMIGLRAARGLRVPLVITLHNHVDAGTRAVTPLAPFVFRALRGWRRLALGRVRPADGAVRIPRRARGAWRYLAELTAEAVRISAPSHHFARELEAHGVRAGAGDGAVRVTPGGVDDAAIEAARAAPRAPRERPRLVWLGRMSHEKRVLELVDAVAASGIDAELVLHGAGLLLPQLRERIARHGLGERVRIAGPVPYAEALAAMRDADALVQTSIGFETQGLTPFEAAALGTPTVFCDPAIADDVAASVEWRAADASVAALASALRTAVAELAAATAAGDAERFRIPAAESARFLQSARSEAMLRLYGEALTRS
ncbi:glycosyltransferase [Leucobacter allii]|uniref:glycosyltransferase n=1 Tax=Leucobacter allii TaxID=2932247 RepID=UPI001FD55189|nr:glycosyltransferase [Leucobacter allii]UOR02102.1 glycosyltransferase [Leucobacter allii]